jgi:hypothetical protein
MSQEATPFICTGKKLLDQYEDIEECDHKLVYNEEFGMFGFSKNVQKKLQTKDENTKG